jgi:TPP-dependent pyruvate/acetoin dehydrogenase alpha subunit
LISREKLVQLYSAMVKSRLIAERTTELAQQGKLPQDWEIGAGSEATLAGVTADLRPEDTLSAPGNRLLWSLVDGISLEGILGSVPAPLNGNGGSASGINGNLSALRNGSSSHAPGWTSIDFSAAVQAAKAYKAAKEGRIALVYCRDSSTADVSGRQLEFVSRHNLPMIILCHFDLWDRQESSPLMRESRIGSVEALAFGVPRIAVDARDVLAVYRVASESIARARQGRGPTLIECVDHGLPADSGNVDHNQTAATDPVHTMASYLGKKRILTASLKQQIESQVYREIDAATKRLMN